MTGPGSWTVCRLAAIGVAVVLAILGVSSCGTDSADGPDGDPPPGSEVCVDLPPTAPPELDDIGQTVILLDRSNSIRDASGAPGAVIDQGAARVPPDLVHEARKAVAEAARENRTVVISGFDGPMSVQERRGVAMVFPGGEAAAGKKQDRAIACVVDHLMPAALDATPVADGTDVLDALGAGTRGLPAQTRVVVVTDGLSNHGCADLNRAAIGDAEGIDGLVKRCTEAQAVPDLTGLDVRFVGIGAVAPGQPAPTPSQVTWLETLWERLCKEGGANSCEAEPYQPPTYGAEDRRPTPVPAAPERADPVIAFPSVFVTGNRIRLPGSILFNTDSAELLASAPETIDRAVAAIRSEGGTAVTVEGHTDSRGSDAHNADLSRRRADAVARELGVRGVRVSEILPLGSSRPVEPDEYQPDGTPDLQAMAANRRVEIVITSTVP